MGRATGRGMPMMPTAVGAPAGILFLLKLKFCSYYKLWHFLYFSYVALIRVSEGSSW